MIGQSLDVAKVLKQNCLSSASSAVFIYLFRQLRAPRAMTFSFFFFLCVNVYYLLLHFWDFYVDLFRGLDAMLVSPARKMTFYFVFCFLGAYSRTTCLLKCICESEGDLK